ncbi:MAG TPA: 30S ribosomal protein THX [Bacteroidales bacterium]|nr:30S ribosomal protein THX [Bacteroidales bacterium]
MGKGDKKSRRGKIILGTFGVRRPRKKANKPEIKPAKVIRANEKKDIKPVKEVKEVNVIKEETVAKVPIPAKEIKEVKVVKEKTVAKASKPAKGKKEVKTQVKVEKTPKETKPKKEKKN